MFLKTVFKNISLFSHHLLVLKYELSDELIRKFKIVTFSPESIHHYKSMYNRQKKTLWLVDGPRKKGPAYCWSACSGGRSLSSKFIQVIWFTCLKSYIPQICMISHKYPLQSIKMSVLGIRRSESTRHNLNYFWGTYMNKSFTLIPFFLMP